MVQIIPIAALFDDAVGPNLAADPRPILHAAEVIFGVDVMTGKSFLVYGRKTIENFVRTNRYASLNILRIGLDQETDELEKLIALTVVIKGSTTTYRLDQHQVLTTGTNATF